MQEIKNTTQKDLTPREVVEIFEFSFSSYLRLPASIVAILYEELAKQHGIRCFKDILGIVSQEHISELFKMSLPLYSQLPESIVKLLREDDDRPFSLMAHYISNQYDPKADRLYMLPGDFQGVLSDEEKEKAVNDFIPINRKWYPNMLEVERFLSIFNQTTQFAGKRVVRLDKPSPKENKVGVQKLLVLDFEREKLSTEELYSIWQMYEITNSRIDAKREELGL